MEKLSLKQILQERFAIQITPAMCQEMIRIVQQYEIRGEHTQAFNTPYLAVHKAVFLPRDAQAVFDCFDIDQPEFQRACRSCSSISSSWNVTGNDFNLLITWLVYLLGAQKTPQLNQQLVYNTRFALIKLIHYKFFTGKVAVMFKHGVNEGVMRYTIDNLSGKSDIKKEGTNTWRLLIEQHARDVLAPNSVHQGVIRDYAPDVKIIYLLSDMHTRLSSKIKNIAVEYYDNHAKGNAIRDTSMIRVNDDGLNELGELKATLDNVINLIQQQVLNVSSFLNYNHIRLAAGIANIRPELLRNCLTLFSQTAVQQYRQHTGMETKLDKNKQTLYIGYQILIYELVQKSYRRAAVTGANMNSNVEILQKVRDAYRASRILDNSILLIKNSVDLFIEENLHIQREATAVALRTAFILYIIILTFNKR